MNHTKPGLFRLVGVFCVACTGLAHAAPPPAAANNDEMFPASGRITAGTSGRRSAAMTQSTGSKALDHYVEDKAAADFRGLPSGVSFPFFISCKRVSASTPHGKIEVTVAALRPPYPAQARLHHHQGAGVVKVTFGKDGKITAAAMVKSTGSDVLDGNTVNYALAHWASSGGALVTTTFPVAYELH